MCTSAWVLAWRLAFLSSAWLLSGGCLRRGTRLETEAPNKGLIAQQIASTKLSDDWIVNQYFAPEGKISLAIILGRWIWVFAANSGRKKMFAGLRACSISPQQEHQKSQIDELQAGIEQALGIFPKPATLLQPSEWACDHPALRQYGKSMKLMALGYLHRSAG